NGDPGSWRRALGAVDFGASGSARVGLARLRACLQLDAHLAVGDVLDRAAGLDGAGVLLEQFATAVPNSELVVGLDEQPVLLAALVAAPHVHEMPAAFELAAVEVEGEV